jgi:hypothetical protein
MGRLEDAQEEGQGGRVRLTGAVWGINEDSQYRIFEEDDGIVFYRNVEGVIELKFVDGGSIRLDTDVEGYRGTITADGGDDKIVSIKQRE